MAAAEVAADVAALARATAAMTIEIDLDVQLSACFDERHYAIRFRSDPAAASIAVGPETPPLPLAPDDAVRIAHRIATLATRSEVLSGVQSTTRYAATLRWRLVDAGAAPLGGEVTFSTNDAPVAELREIVLARPDLAAQLPPGVYSPAIALFDCAAELAYPAARGSRP